jgi:CubicO group peptidase (beta-lactamase class C family)
MRKSILTGSFLTAMALCLPMEVHHFTKNIVQSPTGVITAITRGPGDIAQDGVVAGELGEKIDNYLTRLNGFGYSGAMLVVRNGQTVLRKGYGWADTEARIPITPETVFDIGSLSKTFTATAVLKLQLAGKLNVNDPLVNYLPNAPSDKANITIHQLLSHTSGLAREIPASFSPLPEEITRTEAIQRIFKTKLEFEPGARYQYSDCGYILLAAVIELAAKEPYTDFVRKNLFLPAGMHSTGFWGNLAPGVPHRFFARGYDELGEIGNPLKWSGTTWVERGDGAILSTLADLYKWHLALVTNRIIPADVRTKMQTPVQSEYGYGWFIQKSARGTTIIQHGGDTPGGFGAQLWWFKDENTIVISLCNVRYEYDSYATRIKADYTVPKIIFGEEYKMPPAFIPSRAPTEFGGTYQLPSGGKLVIGVERGTLEIGANGQDASDVLNEPDAKESEMRAELSRKFQSVFEGFVKGDFGLLASALGTNLDGVRAAKFRDALADEIKQLGKDKGDLKSIETLGTTPAAIPKGVMTTILRFNYENGSGTYMVKSRNGEIVSTDLRAPRLSAVTPLQMASDRSLIGWNILSSKGFRLDFEVQSGAITGVIIHGDSHEWSAHKI